MKKIAIIGPSSLAYMPYLAYYEGILSEGGIPYDLFFWDRYHLDEENRKGHSFSCKSPPNGLGSIYGYIGFRRFLLHKFNEHDYCFHIILTTQVGILLYQYLKDKKYILDIRDFSHERNPAYKFLMKHLIDAAVTVAISSDGFRRWLPIGKEYLLSHNISLDRLHYGNFPPRFDRDKLVISYIGAVGYFDANIRIINAAANYNNIHLRYIGSGTCENDLKTYCKKKRIHNVEFLGRYRPEQKPSFYKETDFILSCYGQNSLVEQTSIPNRFYESCVFGRPIIVNTGSYLAELVRQNGLGIVIDLGDIGDLYGKLIPYAETEVYRQYLFNREVFLKKIVDDVVFFRTTVGRILKENYI